MRTASSKRRVATTCSRRARSAARRRSRFPALRLEPRRVGRFRRRTASGENQYGQRRMDLARTAGLPARIAIRLERCRRRCVHEGPDRPGLLGAADDLAYVSGDRAAVAQRRRHADLAASAVIFSTWSSICCVRSSMPGRRLLAASRVWPRWPRSSSALPRTLNGLAAYTFHLAVAVGEQDVEGRGTFPDPRQRPGQAFVGIGQCARDQLDVLQDRNEFVAHLVGQRGQARRRARTSAAPGPRRAASCRVRARFPVWPNRPGPPCATLPGRRE
jgi:hypothetical protein